MASTPPPITHRPPPDITGATAFFQRFVRTPKMKQNFSETQELRNQLITYLAKGVNIPPYPAVVSKIERMLNKEDVDLSDVGESVLLDPGLVAEVLRMANTARYGGGGIHSVQECLQRLGVGQFRKVLMIHGSIKSMKQFKSENWVNFWLHSILTARLTELVYSCYDQPIGDEYVAGLLHDTGKLFLLKLFPEQFKKSVELKKEKACSSEEAEFEVFGFSHADLSANLCMRWEMNPLLMDAVKYHHHPASPDVNKKARLLAAALSVANDLANLCNLNIEGSDTVTMETLQESEAWKALEKFERVNDFEIDVAAELEHVRELAASVSGD